MENRRNFLSTLAGGTAALALKTEPALATEAAESHTPSGIRITDLKTTVLNAHWGPWNRRWLLVRIDTDRGISGYGDTWASPQVRAIVRGYKSRLVGQDPTNVEPLIRSFIPRAYPLVGAGSHFDQEGLTAHAISAIETALWDIAGKAAGVPVYKLLGGKHRENVRLYCCVGDLDDYRNMQESYDEMGIAILKFDAVPREEGYVMDTHLTRRGLDGVVDQIEEIRNYIDDEVEISVECRVGTLHSALRYLKAVEPFDLAWVEDPLPATNVDSWAILTASSATPTLTGEGLHYRHQFLPYYKKSAMRIAAPDFQICGGISEGRKIAELADLHSMMTAPHNASSAIGIAAALHACAAIPNLLALEFHAMPRWDRILKGYRPRISDGSIEIPEGPGLGVELDEKEARKYLPPNEGYFED